MKRIDLLRELRKIAKQAGVTLEEAEGSNHSKVVINGQPIPVPRHREIAEGTARSIIRIAKEATE